MTLRIDEPKTFASVAQLAQLQPAFSVAALRQHVFKAQQNGLAPAIRRIGKRVLIDVAAFSRWVDTGSAK